VCGILEHGALRRLSCGGGCGARPLGRLLEVGSGAVQSLEDLAGRGAGGELEGEDGGDGRGAGDQDEHAEVAHNRRQTLRTNNKI
jgi:hypothetical protein